MKGKVKFACIMSVLFCLAFVSIFSIVRAATPTPQKIKIKAAGAPAALAWYPAAVALHGFISDNSKLDITTASTGGPLQITAAVVRGAADIGLQGVNNMMAYAYRGIYDFKGKPAKNLRNLLLVGGMYVSMLTVPSTGIKTFYDLRGKRIAWYTASTNDYIEALLRVHGIDPEKDIIKVRVPSMAEAHVEIGLGRLHAASTALLPSKSLLELQEAARGIWFIPVEKEKILEGKSKFPDQLAGIIPGIYQPAMQPALKIEKPTPVTLFPIGVACLDSLNEEVAYLYVKTILENVNKIKSLNPVLRGLSLERAASTSFEVPYHEGAIRAFKEKGLWTPEQEEFQQKFFR
jgi:TRAP transporter TAXI family solute receptor